MQEAFRDIARNISKGTVHFWLIDLNMNPDLVSSYAQILSSEERSKGNNFHFKKDQNRYVIGRGVLRKLAGSYLQCLPENVCFNYSKYGKPQINSPAHLHFNLSHSDNLIGIGFTTQLEIGIDLERVLPDIDYKNISELVFSKAELGTLTHLKRSEAIHQFYTLWTRKEAFIKGVGFGFSMPVPLPSFSVHLGKVKFHNKKSHAITQDSANWHISSLMAPDNYKAAVAVKGNLKEVCSYYWEHAIN